MTNKHNKIVITLVLVFFILDCCYIQFAIIRGVDILFPGIWVMLDICFVLYTTIIVIINKLTNLKFPILSRCLLIPSYFFIIIESVKLIIFVISLVIWVVYHLAPAQK